MAKLDHTIVRPFTPSFDPSTEREWMKAVETRVLENGDGSTHDRLQAAMAFARVKVLSKREKRVSVSAHHVQTSSTPTLDGETPASGIGMSSREM
jgi:hypothetical protein